MLITSARRPDFSEQDAEGLALTLFGLSGSARALAGERDRNFYLRSESGEEFVLKIANSEETRDNLDLQNRAIDHLTSRSQSAICPRVRTGPSGREIATVESGRGSRHFVRLLTYLNGTPLAEITMHSPFLLRSLGGFLGTIDRMLRDFRHPAAERMLYWDLKNVGPVIEEYIDNIADSGRRSIVAGFLERYERTLVPKRAQLRESFIHSDANDHNVITASAEPAEDNPGDRKVIGIVDFGDAVHTHTVNELAIALAYVMLGKEDPIASAGYVVSGYNDVNPLPELEVELLFTLACLRLSMSVTISAFQRKVEPDNPYLRVSEEPAWLLLERLIHVDPDWAHYVFRQSCRMPRGPMPAIAAPFDFVLGARSRLIGGALSLSYKRPLRIVRGDMQYLYDDTGGRYLDAVNNVSHVGHCHPRVVEAAYRQMSMLNTNTRYLHDNLVEYAERLCATMPDPLNVCFFVCTGSEANELAIRLAKAHTGGSDFIVVEGAYHGNTSSLIEMSPYKFDGPGGNGAPPHVHKVPMPDMYRGAYKSDHPDAGRAYACYVREALRLLAAGGVKAAAFFCESLLGCGGQIVLPEGYLKEAYRWVREAGGVCVADEVQVGFGRVGTRFWGFETQGVVPDIVTLGKPMGNGHPMAAVVTTPEIAASFDNGMEYFNTFGGNPVSCAVGMAVLDVIEDEHLQENAARVGAILKRGLEDLAAKHPLIGDVRGMGLFIGVELVTDRETLKPAAEEAAQIIERMKDRGILVSIDGPLRNVLKIKPPLVFNEENADLLADTLAKVLDQIGRP